MSAEGRGITELNEAAARLDRIAAELADPQTTDAAAVELAQEAARIGRRDDGRRGGSGRCRARFRELLIGGRLPG